MENFGVSCLSCSIWKYLTVKMRVGIIGPEVSFLLTIFKLNSTGSKSWALLFKYVVSCWAWASWACSYEELSIFLCQLLNSFPEFAGF